VPLFLAISDNALLALIWLTIKISINKESCSMEEQKKEKGRGWHGNSEGHAKAGRRGGLAKSKKNRK